jgi:hypothetical protein
MSKIHIGRISSNTLPENDLYNIFPDGKKGCNWNINNAILNWQPAWAQTLSADNGGNENRSFRNVLKSFAFAGNLVRVTFNASSAGSLLVNNASIVKWSGTDADGVLPGPVELKFSGGNSGFSLTAGQTIVSDPLFFTTEVNQHYIIIIDSGANGEFRVGTFTVGIIQTMHKYGVASYNQLDGTNGWTGGSTYNYSFGVSKVEVAQ